MGKAREEEARGGRRDVGLGRTRWHEGDKAGGRQGGRGWTRRNEGDRHATAGGRGRAKETKRARRRRDGRRRDAGPVGWVRVEEGGRG